MRDRPRCIKEHPVPRPRPHARLFWPPIPRLKPVPAREPLSCSASKKAAGRRLIRKPAKSSRLNRPPPRPLPPERYRYRPRCTRGVQGMVTPPLPGSPADGKPAVPNAETAAASPWVRMATGPDRPISPLKALHEFALGKRFSSQSRLDEAPTLPLDCQQC
jgi:hypothetical protein